VCCMSHSDNHVHSVYNIMICVVYCISGNFTSQNQKDDLDAANEELKTTEQKLEDTRKQLQVCGCCVVRFFCDGGCTNHLLKSNFALWYFLMSYTCVGNG